MDIRFKYKFNVGNTYLRDREVVSRLFTEYGYYPRMGGPGIDFTTRDEEFYGDKISFLQWMQIYYLSREYPRRHMTLSAYRGSKGLIFLLDKTDPKAFKDIRSHIEMFNYSNKVDPLVGLIVGNLNEPINQKNMTDEKINGFIEELTKNYGYIPTTELNEDKDGKFDRSKVEGLVREFLKLIYLKYIHQIDVTSSNAFQMIDYLFELNVKRKSKNVKLIGKLKDYIETSNDKFVELIALDKLYQLNVDDEYYKLLIKNNNLCESTRKYSEILLNPNSTKVTKYIYENEKFSLFNKFAISFVNSKSKLKNIYLIHNDKKTKEFSLRRLLELDFKLSDVLIESILLNTDFYNIYDLAIRKLKDEKKIVNVILKIYDWDIKELAISKLKEPIPQKIIDFLKKDSYNERLKYCIIDKINDDETLKEIILSENYEVNKLYIFKKIKNRDANFIRKIFKGPHEWNFSIEVLKMCYDQDLLKEILFSNQSEGLKAYAVINLENPTQEFLISYLEGLEDPKARKLFLERIPIDENLKPQDFKKMISQTKDYKNLVFIIKNCKVKKYLDIMRITLNEDYQPLIRERNLELAKEGIK